MEQMYQDFTAKLLPQIQQGLIITKDYFLDFFGRYVEYLIIIDSLSVVLGVILLIVGSVFAYKSLKYKIKHNYDDPIHLIIPAFFCIVIGLPVALVSTNNIIKDIYIPEVRVIELINQNR